MRKRVLVILTAIAMLACGWLLGSGAFAQEAAKDAAAPCVAPHWTIHGGEGMQTWLLNTETGATWRFISYPDAAWIYEGR